MKRLLEYWPELLQFGLLLFLVVVVGHQAERNAWLERRVSLLEDVVSGKVE